MGSIRQWVVWGVVAEASVAGACAVVGGRSRVGGRSLAAGGRSRVGVEVACW